MKLSILLISFLLVAIACKKQVSTHKPYWDNIYMNLDDHQELIIYNNGDSVVFKRWIDSLILSTTSSTSAVRAYQRTNETSTTFKISTIEKDSLVQWTNKLLKPEIVTEFCTDLTGHLIVKINFSSAEPRITKSCEYSSICNWYSVDMESTALYNFLKSKKVDIQ